jgi:hypothetical protein
MAEGHEIRTIHASLVAGAPIGDKRVRSERPYFGEAY